MLKEQKTNTVVLGLVVILGILWATSVAEAALDIEKIYISCHQDYDEYPIAFWQFDVEVDLVDPGTLHHIDVTPPAGGHPLPSMTIGNTMIRPSIPPSRPCRQTTHPETTLSNSAIA